MNTDLSPEELIRFGDRVYRDIAAYFQHPEKYRVLPDVSPGDVRRQLPNSPPTQSEPMDAILDDFEKILKPALTHWNHPGFMAYFANSSPGPAILAETLVAAYNQNAMLWRTSPAATELEQVVMSWLQRLVGLPETFTGVITDTASISSMLAIAAAREAIPGLNIRELGMSGRIDLPLLRLYTSTQAHSSIEKAAITLGIGMRGVRKIETNENYEMDAGALAAAINEDRAEGYLPFCVSATVGTTSTTAIDPVPQIAEICRREAIWLHVDAAYAGSAAIVPELRGLLAGCEHADSFVVNPHKWLFTPVDCSALYVRSPETLKRAFSLVPEYLSTDTDAVNYMDWGVQLGRRFRALKLWMTIRYFGAEGLAELIRDHIRLAREFAVWIDSSSAFERTAPGELSVVCFRAHPPSMDDDERLERLNAELMRRINAAGELFLSHTKVRDRYTLRMAVGNIRTSALYIDLLKARLTSTLEALLESSTTW